MERAGLVRPRRQYTPRMDPLACPVAILSISVVEIGFLLVAIQRCQVVQRLVLIHQSVVEKGMVLARQKTLVHEATKFLQQLGLLPETRRLGQPSGGPLLVCGHARVLGRRIVKRNVGNLAGSRRDAIVMPVCGSLLFTSTTMQ